MHSVALRARYQRGFYNYLMIDYLDYVSCLCGFGFIALAAVSYLADKKSTLPWKWLGLFGIIYGLNIWLGALTMGLGDSSSFAATRICVMVVAFICLVEFGRLGARQVLGKGPSRWLTLGLLLIGCTGWLYGWDGLNIFLSYTLGFVGGLGSAAVLFAAARRSENHSQRIYMTALGALLGTFAAVSGIVVPRGAFPPTVMHGHQVYEFPIQLLIGIIAFASAVCVWQASGSHRTRRNYTLGFVCALLVILVGGWFFTSRTGESERNQWVHHLRSTCTIAAAAINPNLVRSIDFGQYASDPRYVSLRARLMKMRQTSPEFRYVYLMAMKRGRVIFIADSEPTGSKEGSIPGDLYWDAPNELRDLCRGKVSSALATYTDRWGQWTSAYVPVRDEVTGKTLAILGIDYPQAAIHQAICNQRLHAIGVTFLLALLAVVLFCLRERQEWFIETLSKARDSLEERDEHLLCTLHSIGDAVIVVDCSGIIMRINPVAELLTGWTAADAIDRPIFDVFHINCEPTCQMAHDHMARVLATGTKDELADGGMVVSRDGAERRIAGSWSPVRDNHGGIIGLVLVFRDVTEEYEQREQLCESQERYDQLAEQSRVVTWEIDGEGRFTYVSGVSKNVFGYHPMEVINRMCVFDLFSKAERNAKIEDGLALWKKGEPFLNREHKLFSKDGQLVWVSVNGIPLLGTDGALQGYRGNCMDITEKKLAEEEIKRHSGLIASLMDSIPDLVFFKNCDGIYQGCNPAFAEFVGLPREEIVGKTDYDLFDTETADLFSEQDRLTLAHLVARRNEELVKYPDGRSVLLDTHKTPYWELEDTVAGVLGVSRDITERVRAEEALRDSEERFRTITTSAQDAIVMLDNAGDISFWNQAAERIFGYSGDEVLGKSFHRILAPARFHEAIDKAFPDFRVSGNGAVVGHNVELAALRKDGTEFPVELSLSAVQIDGEWRSVGIVRDITERKRAHEALARSMAETERLNHELEEALLVSNQYAQAVEIAKGEIEENAIKLSYKATHDALTGLPNRNYFEQHIGELLSDSTANSLVVLFLDLDKFKLINDTLGHKVGDMLLVAVAGRLKSCVRTEDVLARMGGDEFTAILPDCQDNASAELVSSRMIDTISRPFEIQGHKFVIGASIGLAACPSDGMDSVSLLKHADAAMYKAKQSGRGTFRWYSKDVDVENQQRAEMEIDIRAALEHGQFAIHYQPIVSLNDTTTVAAEALLRWEHPEKGMVSPSLFIPIAEEIGMIGRIGDYVLRTACAQAMAWRNHGMNFSRISVNVSTAQVRDPAWLSSVRDALSDTGLDARFIDLEVTESDFAADCESMRDILRKAEEIGVSLTIDDFGIGHSSLSRLKHFPVTHLKIDGSFVRDIAYNKNDNALLRSIIEMAHGQNIRVTAEWVETEQQMEILRSIGCDFVQGYYISPALPAKAFAKFIRQWTREAKAA